MTLGGSVFQAEETANVKILIQRAFWNVPGIAMEPDHLKHSKPRWGREGGGGGKQVQERWCRFGRIL